MSGSSAKKMLISELIGTVAVMLCSILMRHAYSMSGQGAVGILFGAVNQSAWEQCKTLLLPYLCWGMLELICARPSTRRITAAKTAGVYLLCVVYLLSRLVFNNIQTGECGELILSAASVFLGFAASYAILKSGVKTDGLFCIALSLLFMIIALYFCFTPFPPDGALFTDPVTGLKGIIPTYLDCGAYVMTAAYS